MGVKNTNKQSHRTCVRMSAKDYELLKKKSAAAGLSANAWLMAQLETNRPVLHREEETWEAIRFMDEAGWEINVIARDFNSGYGTAEQLRHAVHLLGAVYERLYALRKKGYLHAGLQQKPLCPHDGGAVPAASTVYGNDQAAQHGLFLPADSGKRFQRSLTETESRPARQRQQDLLQREADNPPSTGQRHGCRSCLKTAFSNG